MSQNICHVLHFNLISTIRQTRLKLETTSSLHSIKHYPLSALLHENKPQCPEEPSPQINHLRPTIPSKAPGRASATGRTTTYVSFRISSPTFPFFLSLVGCDLGLPFPTLLLLHISSPSPFRPSSPAPSPSTFPSPLSPLLPFFPTPTTPRPFS